MPSEKKNVPLKSIEYDIGGNSVRAFYDANGKLVFVLDLTTSDIKPNVLLVMTSNGNRKWDDVLANDYGVNLENVRPKKDNKYQKLDVEYDGLAVYDNLIRAYENGDALDEYLDDLATFRVEAARNSATERMDVARAIADNAQDTIDKTSEIFFYYLKLSFEFIKKELKEYQNELDDKSKEAIINHYQKERPISKKDFACAIRLFATLVLFLEEDKEQKIKSNRNNIVNYLRAADLWSKDIYDNDDFNNNLNELKSINAQINQIIYLYEELGRDIESNFANDVIDQIEKDNKPTNSPEEITNSVNDGNNGNDEEDDDDLFAADEDNENDDVPRD